MNKQAQNIHVAMGSELGKKAAGSWEGIKAVVKTNHPYNRNFDL